jgi:hypothetical protein
MWQKNVTIGNVNKLTVQIQFARGKDRWHLPSEWWAQSSANMALQISATVADNTSATKFGTCRYIISPDPLHIRRLCSKSLDHIGVQHCHLTVSPHKINKHYKYSTKAEYYPNRNVSACATLQGYGVSSWLIHSFWSHLTRTKIEFLPPDWTHAQNIINCINSSTPPKLQYLSSSVQLLSYADLCPCDAWQVYQSKVILWQRYRATHQQTKNSHHFKLAEMKK